MDPNQLLDALKEEYGAEAAEKASEYAKMRSQLLLTETTAEFRNRLTSLMGASKRTSAYLGQNEDVIQIEKDVKALYRLVIEAESLSKSLIQGERELRE